MSRQTLRVWEKGQLATTAVLDSIEQAQRKGELMPEEAAEFAVALAAADFVAQTGRKWHGTAADAAVRQEQAVEALEVALGRLKAVGAP